MFIRETKKSISKSGKTAFQYVLIQSTRIDGKPRQTSVLYLGSHLFLRDKVLRQKIGKALEEKIYQRRVLHGIDACYDLLEAPYRQHVDQWYAKFLEKEQNDDKLRALPRPVDPKTAVFEEVNVSEVNVADCKHVGAEWLCLKAALELGIDQFLMSKGFTKKEAELALLSIISRAVFPASEHKTAQWLEKNSALWELFASMDAPPGRFPLYRIAEKLSHLFDDFTDHVYQKSMDLFSIKDTLMIYELSNTYFEGRKLGSILAKFGRSKEKRNDCKLVSFSAVVNKHGFLKYSHMYEGNISESGTLLETIKALRLKSQSRAPEQVVVMDAGIATNDNLQALRAVGQKYVCVSRTKLKDYETHLSKDLYKLTDHQGNKIEVKLLEPEEQADRWLLVRSDLKKKKEQAMLTQAELRYERELEKIRKGILSKSGIKKLEKVCERIGRAKEKYPSVHKRYELKVTEGKGKMKGRALELSWTRTGEDNRSGVYFIRTNLEGKNERQIWDIYNTIREVESTFRCLKTDLSIRPVFHQKDKYSTAHIQLGFMAYQIVTAIRYRLKLKDIRSNWSNIVRIMNTQMMNTIHLQTKTKDIHIRRSSVPEKRVRQIFEIMGIKKFPKKTTKRVVYH